MATKRREQGSWQQERARVASLTRSRTADDPELIEARQNLKSARLALVITKAINSEPALTDSQLRQLAQIFHRATQYLAS